MTFVKHTHVSENVTAATIKVNSTLGERQITNDAAFWLPLVKPEHFTWLDDESNILENHVFEQISGNY